MPEDALNQEKKYTINIAIFASGTGSNAQKIIEQSKNSSLARVGLIVCNNPLANVLKIAASEQIPSLIIKKDQFYNGGGYLSELQKSGIDFIVLAGFLWKIPALLISAYLNKIINIHPALLPKFGGRNMYGNKVHEAIIASGDKESGITIHYVDGEYDNGDIIFQQRCVIAEDETPETLADKIHLLEHQNYYRVIERVIKNETVA